MRSPMTTNRHRIQRQVIELSLGGDHAMPATQEVLARAFHDELVPELTAAFDRVAGADRLLRLDRLEVDLGTIQSDDWRPELRRRLGEELARKLSSYMPEDIPTHGPAQCGPAEPLRQFLYFLRHGRLAWWGERAVAQWPTSLPESALDSPALHAILFAEADARSRFIDSLDDVWLDKAVARWGAVPHAARLLELLALPGANQQARREWRRWFWRELLALAVKPG